MGIKIHRDSDLNNSSVSKDGVSQEEAVKKKIKLMDLFISFDISKDGILDSKELLAALDIFNAADKDKNGKITTKELNELADSFNKKLDLQGEDVLKTGDMRKFLNNIEKAVKKDEKISRVVLNFDSEKQLSDAVSRLEQMEHALTEEAKYELNQSVLDFNEDYNLSDELKNMEFKPFSYTVQYNENFIDLIKRILAKQGVENPTQEEIDNAVAQFKKMNPDKVHKYDDGTEYLLVGEKINLPVNLGDKNNADEQISQYEKDRDAKIAEQQATEQAAQLAEQQAAEKEAARKEIENYHNLRDEAKAIADELFDICDNNARAIGTVEFRNALNKITPENIVEVLNQYDASEAQHQGDTSLMDTIRSEGSNAITEKEALTKIIDTLAQAAKNAKVDDADIEKAVNDYKNSMEEQYAAFHTVNPKDMEKAVDFLRGSIEAKRQAENAVEIEDTDAAKIFSNVFAADDKIAREDYKTARDEEGWVAVTGDWVCGLFGCNTIKDMNEKLGANAKDAVRLAEIAQKGDMNEFKKAYKDVFGIDFDPKKIAVREGARTNLDAAYALNNTIDIFSDILKNADLNYNELKKACSEKLNWNDDTIEQAIKNYAINGNIEIKTDEDKAYALHSVIQEARTDVEKQLSVLSKGRTLQQMEKDFDLLTKSAYGTKDIVKDVIQFNENQQTTEMVTLAAAEIAGTIALQFVPGLGQVAAARLAVSAAKWGTRATKIVNAANRASSALKTYKNITDATVGSRALTNIARTGAATAAVDALDKKDVNTILERVLMNSTFAGIGAMSSVVAPQIAAKLGTSSKGIKEGIEEALNTAATAGYISSTGGEYKLEDGGIDFVSGMIMARLSYVKNVSEVVSRPRKNNQTPVQDMLVPDEHRRTYETPHTPDRGPTITWDEARRQQQQPILEKPAPTSESSVTRNDATNGQIPTETPFVKATKNPNNPVDIAPNGTVGKIGDEKFEGFVDEVKEKAIKADDAQLQELDKRSQSLRNRDQRRTLQNIVGDETLLRNISNETNLGELYKLERNVKQWNDKSRRQAEILDAIQKRRESLQASNSFTVKQHNIDPKLKASVDASLSQPKRHLNPDQIRDIRVYIESLTDPTELNRVTEQLEKRMKLKSGRLKRAIDAKRAELNMNSRNLSDDAVVHSSEGAGSNPVQPQTPKTDMSNSAETPVAPALATISWQDALNGVKNSDNAAPTPRETRAVSDEIPKETPVDGGKKDLSSDEIVAEFNPPDWYKKQHNLSNTDEVEVVRVVSNEAKHGTTASTPVLDRFSSNGNAKERSVRLAPDKFENVKTELDNAVKLSTTTEQLDALQKKINVLSDRSQRRSLEKIIDARRKELPADNVSNKVNQKILNTEFRDGLLAKIDDAAANFKPQKPLPAGVTSETRGVTDSPDPVKEEAVTPKKVDSENAKRTEEAKHAEKIRRDYYQRIKSIHFSKDGGLYSRELKMYENFQRAMHKLLIATDGKVKLPENIRFRDIPQKSTGLACYETGTLDISVNRCFIDNIDSMLKDLVKDLQDVNMLNVDIDGKIHIPDFLKNDITLKLENKLNAYNDTMSLADKFEIYSQMGYYASLQSQIRRHPHITIEKIMKNGDNISALKEQGLYKTKQEVTAMNKDEQIAYLKQIAAITGIPENAVLIRDGAQVYLHELGHLNQASNCSKEDYYTLLHSKELIEEHQNNSEIQDICSKVSRYAQSQPCEFVAEVFSGLAAGQKFDADVMALYAKYKGPQLFD